MKCIALSACVREYSLVGVLSGVTGCIWSFAGNAVITLSSVRVLTERGRRDDIPKSSQAAVAGGFKIGATFYGERCRLRHLGGGVGCKNFGGPLPFLHIFLYV